MRLMIYHHRGAGTGAVSGEDLMGSFRAEGFRPSSLQKTAERDASRAEDTILIAGGDGTVERAFDLFGGAGRRFAILPIGGGNNSA